MIVALCDAIALCYDAIDDSLDSDHKERDGKCCAKCNSFSAEALLPLMVNNGLFP
jgi:hypothetical protein